MGIYDSIKIETICPKCNKKNTDYVQTHDLQTMGKYYKIGDYIGTKKFNYLECISSCDGENTLYFHDYYIFYIRVYLQDGIILNKYDLITQDDEIIGE